MGLGFRLRPGRLRPEEADHPLLSTMEDQHITQHNGRSSHYSAQWKNACEGTKGRESAGVRPRHRMAPPEVLTVAPAESSSLSPSLLFCDSHSSLLSRWGKRRSAPGSSLWDTLPVSPVSSLCSFGPSISCLPAVTIIPAPPHLVPCKHAAVKSLNPCPYDKGRGLSCSNPGT